MPSHLSHISNSSLTLRCNLYAQHLIRCQLAIILISYINISFAFSSAERYHASVSWGEKPRGRDKGLAILACTTALGETAHLRCRWVYRLFIYDMLHKRQKMGILRARCTFCVLMELYAFVWSSTCCEVITQNWRQAKVLRHSFFNGINKSQFFSELVKEERYGTTLRGGYGWIQKRRRRERR